LLIRLKTTRQAVFFSLFNNRLSFAYNYEKRQYLLTFTNQLSYLSSYFIVYTYPLINSELHSINITANVLNTGSLKWFTSVNGTKIINNYDRQQYYGGVSAYLSQFKYAWTGGWVNRVEFNKLSLGADVLYQVGETVSGNPTPVNSFVLQNAYVGYNIQSKVFKKLEVYANTRNLVQNTTADITDNRKLYGLGFKANF
jgi:hypothetical protein